jgi:hypothetical protein
VITSRQKTRRARKGLTSAEIRNEHQGYKTQEISFVSRRRSNSEQEELNLWK